jgi:membrane-bound lytic murein transglycosylase B
MPVAALRLILAAALGLMAATAVPRAAVAADFAAFLEALWPEAAAAGVSRTTFDRAFAGIGPDPKVISTTRSQPEFNQTFWAYVGSRVSKARIEEGRRLARRWKPWLDRIEAQYGVDRYTVLAIWAMESNFGTGSGSSDIVRSLATLACCTQRRPDYFRTELIAALKILEAHDTEPRAMTGSWAGAMGQTQFMPTSFLKHAVDADGDGRRDIWRSTPDALASIANYLARHGWVRMARWGYEVTLPDGFAYHRISEHEGAAVSAWAALGVARADGERLPDARAKAWLLLPAGARGPALLTLENYWVIKTYNISDSYTVSVGHLADRIRGDGPFRRAWPTGDKALTRAQLEAMQKRLVALGYKLETIDGKVGPATRAAVRGWQAAEGLTADGYPTLDQLRRMGAVR